MTVTQHGYCERCDRRRELVPVAGGDALDSKKDYWRVKPLCANPKAWRYSTVYDPEVVRRLETEQSEERLDRLSSATPVRGDADD